MPSPFPPNATLIFQVPTGSEAIDSLGNPSSETEPLTVQCYLKKGRERSQNTQSIAAGEIPTLYLEGRIVSVVLGGEELEPAALPVSILPGAKAAIEILDLGEVGAAVEGDFFLDVAIASAFGTSAVLGAPIAGYLASQVAWGEAL